METEYEDESISKYREELGKVIEQSENNFEKQLSFISAGAIGTSLLLFGNIFPNMESTSCKPLLLIGWILLIGCLLLNLISQLIAVNFHSRTIVEIDTKKYNHLKADQRISKLRYINVISVALLGAGIFCMIIYTYINL